MNVEFWGMPVADDQMFYCKDCVHDCVPGQQVPGECQGGRKGYYVYNNGDYIVDVHANPVETSSAFDRQVGGGHYKDMAIEPAEYCQRNALNWCEANVVAYVSRHKQKGGREDIEKAIHYLEMLLEMEYEDTAIRKT